MLLIGPSVCLKLFKGHDIQSLGMCAFQHDAGRDIGVVGFFPAQGAKTPAIAGFEAGEIVFWTRRDEVIAGGQRESQKIIGDPGTDDMSAQIMVIRIAAAVPKKSGDRVERAGHQGGAENI